MSSRVDLPILSAPETADAQPSPRLPRWLKRNLPLGGTLAATDRLIQDLGLNTVCEEAKCPNRTECWSRNTATFMVLGRVCTRPCGFCSVERGKPPALEADEPARVAEAARRLNLKHVVITSVTRDDLPDGGADHFRQCVEAVRAETGARVEVLTPDFNGDESALDVILASNPDVFNHNIETVVRLQRKVRRKAAYETSLRVLAYVKEKRPATVTKSGVMLGLGETTREFLDAFADLRSVGVDLLTIGQYLQPTPKHLPVERYVPPEEFVELGRLAERLGFAHVASGPFVRSSYHADEAWQLASHHG
jgi:lipoic acid synthetase